MRWSASMKIAFLGWGSLIWNPRELRISGIWEKDGPCLPIEFARVSKDRRLTLVLHPGVSRVKTLWARATCKDVQEAIHNLAEREGTTEENIGFLSIPDENSRCNVVKSVLPTIKLWTKQKQLDAVVWTDFPSNFKKYSPENALKHLRKLDGKDLSNAEAYVRKAPQQIRTNLRTLLEKELGWTCITNSGEEDNWANLKRKLKKRIIEKSPDNSYWVVVPEEPCTFGHLLVISWEGSQEQDITDAGLFTDDNHIQKLMRTAHEFAFMMKTCLTSNGEANGKKCERIYLVSECDTKSFPFHFHLIPRFECEKTGNIFLFEKELEEARWMLNEDEEEEKIQDGFGRIAGGEAVLNYHKWQLLSDRWARSNPEREEFIKSMMKWWNEHLTPNSNSKKSMI